MASLVDPLFDPVDAGLREVQEDKHHCDHVALGASLPENPLQAPAQESRFENQILSCSETLFHLSGEFPASIRARLGCSGLSSAAKASALRYL